MGEKKFKQVCKCEHCGSEAEMMITGTLAEDLPQEAAPAVVPEVQGKTKGHSVIRKSSQPNPEQPGSKNSPRQIGRVTCRERILIRTESIWD